MEVDRFGDEPIEPSMFLATTADQRFWKKDEKILFLGEWCKIYDQRRVWSSLDHQVLSYHWDDRERLHQDFLHLNTLHERYLKLLADRLNDIHHVDQSVRYWRIIIGPWLYLFIEILYDCYLSIRAAIESGLVTNTWIAPYTPGKWTPKDYGSYVKLATSDEYHQYLYSRIIETIGGIHFEIKGEKTSPPLSPLSITNQGPHFKRMARRLLEIYARHLPERWNRVVFVDSYLNRLDLAKLQLSMGQMPYLCAPRVIPGEVPVDQRVRKGLVLAHGVDQFESLLYGLIADNIPKAYVEGYTIMHQQAVATFPKQPQVILTANAYHSNEGFKFWAAHQVDCGTKLVGSQHGGNYGSGLWSAAECHEINVCDRYYTWGWQTENEPKTVVLSAGKLSKVQRTVRPDPKGCVLWVVMSLPRYSYWMYSVPVGPQMLDYLNEQQRFAQSVSSTAHNLLLLRLYPHDWGWMEASRWADMDRTLKRYQGRKSFNQQLSESRLFIGTYNATTYLESLSANFPTILFWNPKHWELRPSAQPYFDDLHRVGILYYTPEEAAARVSEIYEDPGSWWQQPEIQEVRGQFCHQFARTSENWLKEWATELKWLADGSTLLTRK